MSATTSTFLVERVCPQRQNVGVPHDLFPFKIKVLMPPESGNHIRCNALVVYKVHWQSINSLLKSGKLRGNKQGCYVCEHMGRIIE
jgi:hypothetical protein